VPPHRQFQSGDLAVTDPGDTSERSPGADGPLGSAEPAEPRGATAGEERPGGDDDPGWSWGAIVGLYLLAIVYVSAVGIALGSVLGMHEAVLISQVVGVLGAAFMLREISSGEPAPWPDLDRLGLGPGQLVEAIVAVVFLGMAANALMAVEVELFPVLEPAAERYEAYIGELVLEAAGLERALGIVGICVAAPLCEEMLFRGTFLAEKLRTGTATTAVIVNGVLFAAFHQNPISFVPLAFVGMFLADLAVQAGTLWSAIVAHAALNAVNGLVVPEILPAGEASEVTSLVVSPFEFDVVLAPTVQLLVVCAAFAGAGAALWAHLHTSLAERDGAAG